MNSEFDTLRIGARAHDFGRHSAAELARRIAAQDLQAVQLALGKAITGLENFQLGQLNPGLAFQVGAAFRQQGVQIAVLGCYINPIHPNEGERRRLLRWFKEHLRFARDFGCGIVALESGSVNADYSPSPENHREESFHALLSSLCELVAEAERFGVIVGLEAVASHTVSSPKKMRRVLDMVRSNNLQVVFDPVNLLSAENHLDQARIVGEALELFGDRVAVVHAKDFVVENGALRTVPAGRGQLDYGPVLNFIRSRKPGISVLLEETVEAAIPGCQKFLQEKYQALNL